MNILVESPCIQMFCIGINYTYMCILLSRNNVMMLYCRPSSRGFCVHRQIRTRPRSFIYDRLNNCSCRHDLLNGINVYDNRTHADKHTMFAGPNVPILCVVHINVVFDIIKQQSGVSIRTTKFEKYISIVGELGC